MECECVSAGASFPDSRYASFGPCPSAVTRSPTAARRAVNRHGSTHSLARSLARARCALASLRGRLTARTRDRGHGGVAADDPGAAGRHQQPPRRKRHDMSDLLTFHPWSDPLIDRYDNEPDSIVSRLCWLPIIGPTSWLIWGTLARQLEHDDSVTWDPAALAEAHGIARSTSTNGPLRRTLTRLTQFHLFTAHHGDRYLVRITAPPLTRRQLQRLPIYVAAVHDDAYRIACPTAG